MPPEAGQPKRPRTVPEPAASAPHEAPAGPGRIEAVALAVAGLAFAVIALLLREATPVPAAIFDASAAALALTALSFPLHRALGAAGATLARGAGAALAALIALPAFPLLEDAAWPAALAIGGLALLQSSTRAARHGGPLLAAGLMLLLGGLGAGYANAEAWPHPGRLRAVLLTVAIAAALGMPLRHALRRTRWRAQAPTPLGIVVSTALLAVYVLYRPVAAGEVDNLVLYEWTLAAGLSLLLLARLRRAARRDEAPEPWAMDARRHAQDVRPLYDERMAPLAAVFQRYLERGEGYEAYVDALTRGLDSPVPPHLLDALSAASAPPRVPTPRGRRAAAERRLAAHRAVAAHIASRGVPHGATPPDLRAHP